jgi:hypothetical protein
LTLIEHRAFDAPRGTQARRHDTPAAGAGGDAEGTVDAPRAALERPVGDATVDELRAGSSNLCLHAAQERRRAGVKPTALREPSAH